MTIRRSARSETTPLAATMPAARLLQLLPGSPDTTNYDCNGSESCGSGLGGTRITALDCVLVDSINWPGSQALKVMFCVTRTQSRVLAEFVFKSMASSI